MKVTVSSLFLKGHFKLCKIIRQINDLLREKRDEHEHKFGYVCIDNITSFYGKIVNIQQTMEQLGQYSRIDQVKHLKDSLGPLLNTSPNLFLPVMW